MSVDLKAVLDQTKIALEREASNKFGEAVADFAKDTVSGLLGTSSGSGSNGAVSRPTNSTFVPSSYAAALAGGTSYRPKLKFLFKVEFIFTPKAIEEFPHVFGGTKSNDFTFMVKTVDRPKIDFEYEEEVNMYNYRTKALKRIKHRELTVTFLDDVGNRVISFFRAMLMMQSPITRRQLQREGSTAPPDPSSVNSGSGMEFSPSAANRSPSDIASRAVVNSSAGNVIQTIRVKQMYMDSTDGSSREIIYDFLNARIVSFDLDDLGHEMSEASLITMQFDYDWMEIVDVGAVSSIDGPIYSVVVPGSTAPVDMSSSGVGAGGSGGGAGGVGGMGGSGGGAGGGSSAFSTIISQQAGGVAKSLTSDAINKAVQSVAGNGVFGQMIGSQAANAVSGLVGSAVKDMTNGATNLITTQAKEMVTTSDIGQRVIGVTESVKSSVGDFFSNLRL